MRYSFAPAAPDSGRRPFRSRLGLPSMPKLFSDPDDIAEDIIRDVGTDLVVGLPLGLGKANHIVNALYARAVADRAISLTFYSALTLEKPKPKNLVQWRFIAPVIDRLFGGYPDLVYADALRAGALPPNIRVIEFFFLAGKWLHVPFAQQHYISANYTHASSYILARGLNVVTQLVAKRVVDGVTRYSLSCNTDTTLDILRARGEGRASFKLVGQVNSELPFMPGAGDLPAEQFSAVLDSPATDFPLFAPPSEPIADSQYAIGLHAAGLVRDGGSLQIGIGQTGDALAQGLIVRHRDNAQFHGIMKRLSPGGEAPAALQTGSFENGLYGVSEMLTEAFVGLIEAGILKREVDGVVLHGAFFLGPKSFYRALREMTPEPDRADPDDAGILHQRALWRRGRQAARPRRCPLHQQRDDGDPDGGCDFRRPGKRPGRQRRRRPVQFRGAGVRACRRALDPHRRGDAAGRRQAAVEHPLELWPRDHSAASARYRRHRIRRRRSQGKFRRRCDRGDAWRLRTPASRPNWRGRPGMPASCRRIFRSRRRIGRIFRSGSRAR